MKQLKRSLQIVIVSLMVIFVCKSTVWAAGTSISFSDPTAKKGETVSVTVKVTSDKAALGAVDLTLVYDDNALDFTGGGSSVQGGSGSIRIADTASDSKTKTMTYELTFTALKAGKSSISVSNYEVVDFDESVVSVGHVGSSSVEVTDEAVSLSRDASLKSLKLSNGTLSPAFSPSIMKYTASVGADVSSVVVSGTTSNSKAEITSITGADNLKDGDNTVKVSVTAESGATAVYTITVNKAASESEVSEEITATPEPTAEGTVTPEPTTEGTVTPTPTGEAVAAGVTVQVGDKTLTPVALPEGAELKGYTVGTLEYEGQSIEALVSDYMELYVINMQDAAGNQDYYVYYKEIDQFTEFIKIDNGDGKFIVVLDGYPRDISVYGFERTTIMIGEKKVGVAWKYTEELLAYSEAAREYYLVGGLSDAGVNTWYVYDFVEKTYQRYFVQPANLIEEETGPDLTLTEQEQQVKELNDALQKVKRDRLAVIGILAFVALILLLATINLILKVRMLKEDIADLESEGSQEGAVKPAKPEKKQQRAVEPRAPRKERVVQPRAPKGDRALQEETVNEDVSGQEEFAEEIYPQTKETTESRSVKPKRPVKPEKRIVSKPEDEFFDEDDTIPSDVEDEIIKAKMYGSEKTEDLEERSDITNKKTAVPAKQTKVQKPVKTATADKPVRPEKTTVAEKPVRPAQPRKTPTDKPTRPEKPVKTTQPAKSARPVQPAKTTKPSKATKPSKPARAPKTKAELKKEFKMDDFDFEFINLDDE